MDNIEIDLLDLWRKIKFYAPRIVWTGLVIRVGWSFYLNMLDLPEPDWGLWGEFFYR